MHVSFKNGGKDEQVIFPRVAVRQIKSDFKSKFIGTWKDTQHR